MTMLAGGLAYMHKGNETMFIDNCCGDGNGGCASMEKIAQTWV